MSTQDQRRQQIGTDNTNARRASGVVMRDDMRALADPPQLRQPMPTIPKRGGMAAARGTGEYTAVAAAGGGGLASPLTEIGDGASHSSREYYEDQVVYFHSSDYLLAVEIKPLKTLRMVDADGSEATFEFKLPPPSEVL